MNKDAILASIIGFAIGLCITGFLLVGPNILKNLPRISLPRRENITAQQPGNADSGPETTGAASDGGFIVTDPVAEKIVSEKTLTVSGTAEPGSLLVIQGYGEETVIAANSEGKFTSTLTLEEGKTDVIVTNYVSGKPTSKTIPVYYTEEEF